MNDWTEGIRKIGNWLKQSIFTRARPCALPSCLKGSLSMLRSTQVLPATSHWAKSSKLDLRVLNIHASISTQTVSETIRYCKYNVYRCANLISKVQRITTYPTNATNIVPLYSFASTVLVFALVFCFIPATTDQWPYIVEEKLRRNEISSST